MDALSFFRHPAAVGTFIRRIFLAFVLIYRTQDNVFSNEHMMKFRDFAQKVRLSVPAVQRSTFFLFHGPARSRWMYAAGDAAYAQQ